MSAEAMNIKSQVSRGLVARIVESAFAFVGTIVFARLLGPADFGSYYLILAIAMIITRPLIGITDAIKKRSSEIESPHSEMFGLQLLSSFGFIILVSVISVLLSSQLISYVELNQAVLVLILMVLTVGLFSPCQELLVSIQGRFDKKVWLETIRTAIMPFCQVALVLMGWGVVGMAFGYAVSAFLVLPITIYLLHTRPSVPGIDVLRSVWKFARYSILTALMSNVYTRLDVILLGLILSSASVGYYEVASKLTLPATFISGMASTALMPKLSSLSSLDESVTNEIEDVLSYASLLAVPLFFGGLAVAEPLVVTTYGNEYREAALLLPGIALFRLVRTQSQQFRSALNGLDRPNVVLKLSAVALTFNIVTGYILTIKYGTIGVIIATVAAEFIQYFGSWFILRKSLPKFSIFPDLLKYQLLSGIPTYGTAVIVVSISPLGAIHTLVLALLAGAIAYFGTLIILSSEIRKSYLYPQIRSN